MAQQRAWEPEPTFSKVGLERVCMGDKVEKGWCFRACVAAVSLVCVDFKYQVLWPFVPSRSMVMGMP